MSGSGEPSFNGQKISKSDGIEMLPVTSTQDGKSSVIRPNDSLIAIFRGEGTKSYVSSKPKKQQIDPNNEDYLNDLAAQGINFT